ncbi:MAG: SRPBCC family protein [Rhodospirillales bacterium]
MNARRMQEPVAPLSDDPALSPTLPGYYYSDPAVLEREKQAIFFRDWQLIGHRSQLAAAGDYITCEILGQKVFALRDGKDTLRAFFNVCQHRAHELLSGRSGNTRNAVVCPYHAWTYRLDGSLRTARGTEKMPAFDPADYGLVPLRLEEVLGFLFVSLDPEAPSLAERQAAFFADLRREMPWIEEVRVLTDQAIDGLDDGCLEANWKILAENCLECYHCAPAHPAFVDLISIDSYRCTTHDRWQKSYGELRRGDNKAYPVATDAPVRTAIFWHLFPNIQLGCFPGERVISAFSFTPLSAERTALRSFLLAVPGETPTAERLDYVAKVLWPEDEGLCRSVHQGLKSMGYRQGRFVMHPDRPGISENGVHHFQQVYARSLGAAQDSR